MSPERGHPDWNHLAALAEGHPVDGAEALHRHLAGCRRCAAAYAEAARMHARMLAAPRSLAVPADYQALARDLAGGRRRTPRRRRLLGAVAGAAVGLALLVLVRPATVHDAPELAAVRQALHEQAPSGMVLPGLQPHPDAPPTLYRGAEADRGDLAAALLRLEQQHRRDPGSPEAFWLGAAQLAAGRLQAATDQVQAARRRHPEDLPLQLLDAVASYRRSDLGRAETLLREILVRRPDHPEARFNLALVLQETGRPDEAAGLLADIRWPAGSWLAGRVAALRDTLR